jgi:hypothetical protein
MSSCETDFGGIFKVFQTFSTSNLLVLFLFLFLYGRLKVISTLRRSKQIPR